MDQQEVLAFNAFMLMEEEEEYDIVMMQGAAVAVWEVMAMEEEEEVNDGRIWVPVRVFIDDYHNLGDPCFKSHFRMSRNLFELLSTTVFNHLVQKGRLKRLRTPMQDILLMVVWLLATADTFRSVALRFGVNPETLYYFYLYIIQALRELSPDFISWPNANRRAIIKESFHAVSGFPGVIGCIDCTHIQITAPIEEAGRYVNRHHQYSMNVQSVVDHNMLVLMLHVGEAGSLHDNRIFRRSPLRHDLLLGPPDVFRSVDEHIVGDGGYTISDFMMVPFENNGHLLPAQLNFNKRLSQCRVRVEKSYALLKGKWRRLKMLYVRRPDVATDHIIASFVLHNFLILNGEPINQECDLRRPRNNQNIDEPGNANGGEEDGDVDLTALLEDSTMIGIIGIEKRIHIMTNVLPAN